MDSNSIISAILEQANLFDVPSFDWGPHQECFGYVRTSPDQRRPQRNGEYQLQEIQRIAEQRGLKLLGVYRDVGRSGFRVGPKTTPELFKAIESAESLGVPLVALEWRRFCRQPHKLTRYGVNFVTVLPLSIEPDSLDGSCRKIANRHNPRGKGGRPRDDNAALALPFILSRLGSPWTQIARDLGDGWSNNKARRLFNRYFSYVDSLA